MNGSSVIKVKLCNKLCASASPLLMCPNDDRLRRWTIIILRMFSSSDTQFARRIKKQNKSNSINVFNCNWVRRSCRAKWTCQFPISTFESHVWTERPTGRPTNDYLSTSFATIAGRLVGAGQYFYEFQYDLRRRRFWLPFTTPFTTTVSGLVARCERWTLWLFNNTIILAFSIIIVTHGPFRAKSFFFQSTTTMLVYLRCGVRNV